MLKRIAVIAFHLFLIGITGGVWFFVLLVMFLTKKK